MGVIKININTIVNYINERLAGEQLLYSQLLVFLDGTIDDINQALNSNFPAFSEFSEKDENYPDYNFFPDRYIRTVVVTGACAKFYICDEEGAAVTTAITFTSTSARSYISLYDKNGIIKHKVPWGTSSSAKNKFGVNIENDFIIPSGRDSSVSTGCIGILAYNTTTNFYILNPNGLSPEYISESLSNKKN